MKKKGFTLIEVIVSIFILCIIIMIGSQLYMLSLKNFSSIDDQTDSMVNLRIAMDFTADHIRESGNVSTGNNFATVDGNKIYLKNNILRFCTDSQQVADNISYFYVEKINESGLYKIEIGSGIKSASTFITKRK